MEKYSAGQKGKKKKGKMTLSSVLAEAVAH